MADGSEKRIWQEPKLQQLAIRDTAVKGDTGNESGMTACGPAQGAGAQDKCS